MDKELQKNIEKELIENFRVFYISLNQHKTELTEEVGPYLQEIKDLLSISDDVDLKVKFVSVLRDGNEKHSAYQSIQIFNKEGIDLPEEVERFKVEIRAEFNKNNIKYQSTDSHPFFRSSTFVIKENSKSIISKLYIDAVETGKGKAVVVDGRDLQQFSNNRIRLGYQNELNF